MKSPVTICLCLLASAARATPVAAESAITVRATELKKEPYIDARRSPRSLRRKHRENRRARGRRAWKHPVLRAPRLNSARGSPAAG